MERFTHDKCEKDKPKKIKIKIKEKSNARNLKSVVNENDLCPICYCKTQFTCETNCGHNFCGINTSNRFFFFLFYKLYS